MVTDDLFKAIQGLEQERIEEINALRQLQALAKALFEEESRRLAEKFCRNHPRTTPVEIDVFHSTHAAGQLESFTHVDSARLRISHAKQRELIVCGSIKDLQGHGVEDVRVKAYYRDHKRDRSLGTTTTGGDGIFLLCIDPERLPDPVEISSEVHVDVIRRSEEKLHSLTEPIAASSRIIVLLSIRTGEHSIHRKQE